MINKGQIVEIPATSVIYKEEEAVFSSRKDKLMRMAAKRNYDLFDGFLVGEHSGVGNFILGQRKGINVGGKDAPLYVIGINKNTNQLFVGEGENHPGLWTTVIGVNRNQLQTNINLADEPFENGIPVKVHSPLFEIAESAMAYVFGETLFLEFGHPVSIAIQNQPFEIKSENDFTVTININL